MYAIILMATGLIIFATGVIIYSNKQKPAPQKDDKRSIEQIIEMAIADGVLSANEKEIIRGIANKEGADFEEIINDIQLRLSAQEPDTAETALIDYNKKHGEDFEKYIVGKFDKDFFYLKEWAGDKYSEGRYASSTVQPDLLFEFKLKEHKVQFAVECKWRRRFFRNGVEFANPDQFKRYKEFAKKKNIPVYLVIGIGGYGTKPESLYLVPLSETATNFITAEELKKYFKHGESQFFYDTLKQELR
jgi:hypothetical protein